MVSQIIIACGIKILSNYNNVVFLDLNFFLVGTEFAYSDLKVNSTLDWKIQKEKTVDFFSFMGSQAVFRNALFLHLSMKPGHNKNSTRRNKKRKKLALL